MSRTMTRPDAETDGDDMIASIRMLVSDRPAAVAAPVPPRQAPLRLTPDQRLPDPAPAAAAPVDEAALRAMVAEAVRAELQGQAGTRFTRQLRRLIRAEIAEALAARGR